MNDNDRHRDLSPADAEAIRAKRPECGWATWVTGDGRGTRTVELRHDNVLIRRETGRMTSGRAHGLAGEWLLDAAAGCILPVPLVDPARVRAAAPIVPAKAQELDTGALPLFGDQRHQVDLMDLLR